jgi:hypothetical protein
VKQKRWPSSYLDIAFGKAIACRRVPVAKVVRNDPTASAGACAKPRVWLSPIPFRYDQNITSKIRQVSLRGRTRCGAQRSGSNPERSRGRNCSFGGKQCGRRRRQPSPGK